MLSPQALMKAIGNRFKPQRNLSGSMNEVPLWADEFGKMVPPFAGKYGLADEGSLFTASSAAATPPFNYGTTVAQQGQITAFGDTTPLWVIANGAKSDNPARIYLDYLRLLLAGTAPTGTISLELAVRVDAIAKLPTNANQYTINPAVAADGLSVFPGSVYAYLAAQAMATPASSGAVRNAARSRIPTGVAVVGDCYEFRFGTVDGSPRMGLTAARATDPAKMIGDCQAVVINPGEWATIHLWWLTSATNLPTWEWELGLIAR